MAIAEVRFVSDIVASPTTLLDLNDTSRASGLMLGAAGIGLTPPELRTASVSTLLRDGEPRTASAYNNRVIRLPLQLVAGNTEDAGAAAVRNLARQLDKPSNILRVKLGTTQVFFRTYRSQFALDMTRSLLRDGSATIELLAEPFGYGPEETAFSGSIASDPTLASGSYPCYVDITGVKGDVLTPVIITHGSNSLTATTIQVVAYAVRRHGTPSNLVWHRQAEAYTPFGVVTLAANDTVYSPATGSNSVSFSGTGAWPIANDLFSSAASVDMVGTYRIFANVKQSVATDEWRLRLSWGPNLGTASDPIYTWNTAVYLVQADQREELYGHVGTGTTNPRLFDLGLVNTGGYAGVGYGPRDSSRAVETLTIGLAATRLSGAGTLNLDYFLALPADEELAVIRFDTTRTPATYVVDGHNDVAYQLSSGNWNDDSATSIRGRIPQLAPNQTNRLFIVPGIQSDYQRAKTWPVVVTYFPRYLVVPGATA